MVAEVVFHMRAFSLKSACHTVYAGMGLCSPKGKIPFSNSHEAATGTAVTD